MYSCRRAQPERWSTGRGSGPLWLKGDVRENLSDILSRGEVMRTVFYGTGR